MSQHVRAPELDAGLGWLNTDRPLTIAGELQGRVVVLDFWTYCCINCMHVLPDLKRLEHKYAFDPVTFIGVHSAKFTNEASRETIRAAVLRYEIVHPVVIDDRMALWRSYAVRSWPTIVVIDPQGYVAAAFAGEGNRDSIDAAIAQCLQQGRSSGTLAAEPLSLQREAGVRAASGLAFPGKVLADEETGLLFTADSNHNRIIVAELPDAAGRSRVLRIVGSGEIGREDGPADRASFDHPQGMAAGQGNLYVADTENHLIRAIDLASFDVTTIVGTGEMSNDRAGGRMGTQQGINSPWDLTLDGSTLYVAMAGTHQIWRIDLPVGFARAFAGSGRENIVDGPAETAALAQVSGICILGGSIYFADSEVSAIRGVNMAAEQVFTVIGEGLFSFGDVDGDFPEARLQHPLGIEPWDVSLLVADTYNHKIKLVDPAARSVRTLFGNGSPSAQGGNGAVAFFEPGGLSVCGDHLYVADTNNHRIVRIHVETGSWQEVSFEGRAVPREVHGRSGHVIDAKPIQVTAGQELAIELDIDLPAGARLSSEAPWSIRVSEAGRTLAQKTGKLSGRTFPSGEPDPAPAAMRVVVPGEAVTIESHWHLEASFAYCADHGGMCVPVELEWHIPVSAGNGARIVRLRGAVTPPVG